MANRMCAQLSEVVMILVVVGTAFTMGALSSDWWLPDPIARAPASSCPEPELCFTLSKSKNKWPAGRYCLMSEGDHP